MSNSPSNTVTVVCQEIFDDSSQPSEKEIIDYAVKIGIDPRTEPHLLPIAKDGLMQALPKGWKPCYEASLDRYYYYNSETGVSQWEHPLDSTYKEKVRRGRSEGYSSAASLIVTGEDDSKTTAKEDLRSFEEVSSDMLSSRSFDSKLMRRNQPSPLISIVGDEGGSLLARRKQNQRLENEAAAAAAVVSACNNNPTVTTTTLLTNNQTGFRQGGIDEALRVAKQRLTPMRRSQTLEEVLPRREEIWQEDSYSGSNIGLGSGHHDELPSASKWIGDRSLPRRQSDVLQKRPVGILRESPSDPHPPPRRLAPIQGPFGWNEGEDERKRSVRFADLERKSLDIKFDLSTVPTSHSSASNSEEEAAIETDSSEGENNDRKSADGRGRLSESKSSIDSEKTVESSNSGSGERTKRGADSAKSMETSSDSVHKKSAGTSSDSVHRLQKSSESSCSDSRVSSSSYPKQKSSDPVKLSPNTPEQTKETLVKREVSFDDTTMTKLEVEHRKMTTDKISSLEKQLAEQLEQKISALNEEMNQTLLSAKLSIRKKETNEILKLRSEYEKKMKELKETLDEEAKQTESKLRLEKETEINMIISKLEEEKETKLKNTKAEMEQEIERVKESYKESLSAQSENNQTIIEQTRKNSDLRLNEELKAIKEREEAEISKLESDYDNTIQEIKNKYENQIKEIKFSNEKEIEKLLDEHNKNLERIKIEKEGEVRRVEAEWQDKITAAASQHKDILESAIAQHDARLQQLRLQFSKEEEELKKKHAEQLEAWNLRVQKMADKEQSHISHINREFEKMRCEKRLLEDKYRSLKDKYIQMKIEMRMAIERRLQKKKKLQNSQVDGGKVEINVEGCTSLDNDVTRNSHFLGNNNACYLEVPQNDDAQLSSADELLTSTSLTYPSNSKSLKKDDDHGRKGPRSPINIRTPTGPRSPLLAPKTPLGGAKTPTGVPKSPIGNLKSPGVGGTGTTILDNIKTQLHELDYLGEPSTALPDTYLRYPFAGLKKNALTQTMLGGDGRSAEVDFYRHRFVVEEEAVRQARLCLEQQARELQAKHAYIANQPTNTIQQLQQQEKDVTEMEVSLHRTKALLGEKMIRLRLLGHTLASLNTNGEGTDDQNNWKTYDNINAEIQEIWAALDKVTALSTQTPTHNPPPPTLFDYSRYNVTGESSRAQDTLNTVRYNLPTPSSPISTPTPTNNNSNRAEIEAKLASIKEWLQVTSKRASLSL